MNKFAMLFGFMYGDGWIDIHKHGGFSGDKESLQNAKNDLIELFGDIGKAKIRTQKMISPKYKIIGTTSQFAVNSNVSKAFIEAGMPIGKKVEQEWLIPNWIMNGSQDVQQSFLSGLYAAEGFTPITKCEDRSFKPLGLLLTKRLILRNNFEQMMNQLGNIISNVGINYSVARRLTHTCSDNIEIRFNFKNSLQNIYNTTQLLDIRYCVKKHRSFSFVSSYLFEVLNYGSSIINTNNPIYKLTEQQIQYLSEQSGISINRINQYLNGEFSKQSSRRIPYTEFVSNLLFIK